MMHMSLNGTQRARRGAKSANVEVIRVQTEDRRIVQLTLFIPLLEPGSPLRCERPLELLRRFVALAPPRHLLRASSP